MTAAPAGDKPALRARCTATRRSMSDEARAAARAALADRVLRRCRDDGWTCVAAYEPWRSEPGSVELLAGLVSLGARVLVPVTLPDRDLDWVDRGSTAALGPDAVGSADAVLVPALCVAADGTRLGRGGGSYDRALARCAPGVPLVALLFDGELVGALPADPWDRPVTDVVQPSGWTALR